MLPAKDRQNRSYRLTFGLPLHHSPPLPHASDHWRKLLWAESWRNRETHNTELCITKYQSITNNDNDWWECHCTALWHRTKLVQCASGLTKKQGRSVLLNFHLNYAVIKEEALPWPCRPGHWRASLRLRKSHYVIISSILKETGERELGGGGLWQCHDNILIKKSINWATSVFIYALSNYVSRQETDNLALSSSGGYCRVNKHGGLTCLHCCSSADIYFLFLFLFLTMKALADQQRT